MKKIIFITLISFLTTNIFAQNKLGHVNAQEILVQMPAFKTAENDLKKVPDKFREQTEWTAIRTRTTKEVI